MTDPIRPPVTGITPEAATALGIPLTDPRVIVSDETDDEIIDAEIVDFDDGVSEFINPFPTLSALGQEGGPLSDGDTIDAAAGDMSGPGEDIPPTSPGPRQRSLSNLHSGPNWERTGKPREASTRPPSLDEWTTFFGKVVLRVTCDWYLSYAFRGIDEDVLSDRDLERLALSDDERQMIAVPLAEFSNKSKFMKKHGRAIVSAGDSFNALVVLGAWMSRVNRIANKHRPKVQRGKVIPNSPNGRGPQNGSSGSGPETSVFEGSTGGRIPNGYPVYGNGAG
jgi:hypothetical protein